MAGSQQHPLRAWRKASGLSIEQVTALLALDGKRPSSAYLRRIESGTDEAGWELSKRIATLIGADPVTIKEWRPSADKPGEAA